MKAAATRVTLAVTVMALSLGAGCQKDQRQGSLPPGDHPQPSLNGTRQIMKAKLAHMQAVIEGLALNDMEQVRADAHGLYELSQAAQFHAQKSPAYDKLSAEFRQTAADMMQHAIDKNIDAVTLDYVQMTMSCVRCHNYLRDQGLALGR